jgi:hypothetical protein
MARIQLITLISSILFLLCVARLIVKGRLREEYAVIWLFCTALLVVFSIWKQGLEWLTKQFGIEVPTNLVFTVCIFGILVYLLHLSVVASKLRRQNKQLAQEMALLKLEMEMLKNRNN